MRVYFDTWVNAEILTNIGIWLIYEKIVSNILYQAYRA